MVSGSINFVPFVAIFFKDDALNKFWNETNIDKLKGELLQDYDRLNRPENFETPTQCWLGLTIIHMELDETKGVLETHAWMRMNWSDSKLKWDPSKNSNITQINVQPDEVRARFFNYFFFLFHIQ